jgi:hypothetical protein
MARIGTKKPMSITTSDEAASALDRLSKAALIDLYTCALAAAQGECDTPPTMEQIREDAIPLLKLRGDRIPDSLFPTEVTNAN